MITIQEYLIQHNYHTVSNETYGYIEEWETWYEAYEKAVGCNDGEVSPKDGYSLGMAKIISEDWANLLLNERVNIYTGTDFDNRLKEVFGYNNFKVKGNQLIELTFAFGTGAFVEYLDASGKIVIDFIRAAMIYPLSWDNGRIDECAFGRVREREGDRQYYIQIHKLNENGVYVIENHMVDALTGNDVELEEGMLPEVVTGSEKPLFQIVTPNLVNNIDLDSPFGISVFANAISQLKGCDIIYDSYINEFNLGKKRIMVPISMSKIQINENGSLKPAFDKNDTVFYTVPGDREEEGKLDVFNPKIRARDHDLGINKILDFLSFKCGMGAGRYRFEYGTLKSAGENTSDKSDLSQSLKKHEIVLANALKGLVKAIGFLSDTEIDEIHIEFDDSLME